MSKSKESNRVRMYAKGTFSKLRLNFHITLRPGKKKNV